MFGCRAKNLHIGKIDRIAHCNANIGISLSAQMLNDAIDRYPRRFLPASVSAHSVANHTDSTVGRFGCTATVFVAGAD
jgi:hypothetical protein